MSLLSQWQEQILTHAARGTLSVAVYYGQERSRDAGELMTNDVVITTYGTLAAEYAAMLKAGEGGVAVAGAPKSPSHKSSNHKATSRAPARLRPAPFAVRWKRLVLDEAHYIKARGSVSAKAVSSLDAERRWAVTGTPLQNQLDDLFSLLHFLRLSPFEEYTYWKRMIQRPLVEHKDVRALSLLHRALAPLLLRRTKATRGADGLPIIQLPPRHTTIEWLQFTEEERDFYEALRTQSKTRFDAFVAQGKVLNNYATVLCMLMQLRQACDHPFLTLARSDANLDLSKIGSMLLSRWNKQTASAEENGETPSLLVNKGGGGESGGSGVAAGAAAGAAGRRSGGRGGGSSTYLESALDSLRQAAALGGYDKQEEGCAHGGGALGGGDSSGECVVCLEAMDDPVITSCAHVFCRECIMHCICAGSGGKSQVGMCPVCREPVSKHDLITVPRSSRFSVDIERNWKASSKIQALMSDLRRLFNGPPPEPVLPRIDGTSGGPERHVQKCVLVSQWTSMLDLLERPLRDEGIAFVRLDGAMSQQARCETLTRFGGDPNVPVLLLSLRAGGVGLNLVAAQTLYLLDPWWNPAVEEQAINRIHRIGQRYPVSVKRFLMERSVEERILELQKRKEALVKGALAQGEDAKAMRVEDLKELFR